MMSHGRARGERYSIGRNVPFGPDEAEAIELTRSMSLLRVLLMSSVICVLGIYLPFSPLGAAIGLQPLPIAYFPWLAGTLLCYCLVAQLMKTVYIRRFGQWF